MNTYNPFAIGRYYKFFVESDGSAYTLTSKDISSVTIDTGKLVMPENFVVGDVVHQLHGISGGSGTTVTGNGVTIDAATGASLVALADVDEFDYDTIFVFGYYVPASEVAVKKTTKKTAKKAE